MRFIELSSNKADKADKAGFNIEIQSKQQRSSDQHSPSSQSLPIQFLSKRIDQIELDQKQSIKNLQDQEQRILFQITNTENTNFQLKAQMQEMVSQNKEFRNDLEQITQQQQHMNQIIAAYIQQQQISQYKQIQPQQQVQIQQKQIDQLITQNNSKDLQNNIIRFDADSKQYQEQRPQFQQDNQINNNTMFLQNEQMQTITRISDYAATEDNQQEKQQPTKMDQVYAADLDDLDLEEIRDDIQQEIQIDK